MKSIFTFLLLLISIGTNAQSGADHPNLLSPKPGILLNGSQCLIGNTIWSCTPKTCDSIVIYAGDSIEFCTGQQIFLNTDTAYYMEWNFSGSDNFPMLIHNDYPNTTPICYYPIWTVPGNYDVDVYYNGWLSAYPASDCYSFGPSHWIIKVIVLSSPNGIENNETDNIEASVSPNPGTGVFHIDIPRAERITHIIISNVTGETILEKTGMNDSSFDISSSPSGIYFLRIETEAGFWILKILKE